MKIVVWLGLVFAMIASGQEADLLLMHGKIITLDAAEHTAEAMAVKDGKIVATGATAELMAMKGSKTEVIDLAGKTVLPGLIETHCHSVGTARDAVTSTYQELHSIAEMQAWIAKRAKDVPPGTWIEVPRNEITRLKEHRHPTPEELDVGTTDHPVLYTSVTKHVLNTAGWKAIGVVNEKSTIPDGEILRNEVGRPVLIRGGNVTVHRDLQAPKVPHDEVLASLKKLHGIYNSVGITSIFERATDKEGMGLFTAMHEKGELSVRVTGTFRFGAKTPAAVEKAIASFGWQPGQGDEWVKAGPLKITVDGGIHWGTTWLSEPYGPKRTAFYRNPDPAYTGDHNFTPEEMKMIFGIGTRQGWQMSAHVTGDAGTLAVLEAVAAVAQEQPVIKQRRFTLIHSYFPNPTILKLCKDLGVGVDTQGYLYHRDADILAEIYGEPWAERFIGLGDWARAGVPVAINSDHMIGFDPDHAMNSFNPFLMLWIAVARKTDQGHVHGEHQKLSRLDALRAVTLWAAWLSFDEKKLGSLEPGKLADFVVIDRDYLACPEDDIRGIKALRTVVGGRTVFERR